MRGGLKFRYDGNTNKYNYQLLEKSATQTQLGRYLMRLVGEQ